jgi:hypothetical protein
VREEDRGLRREVLAVILPNIHPDSEVESYSCSARLELTGEAVEFDKPRAAFTLAEVIRALVEEAKERGWNLEVVEAGVM